MKTKIISGKKNKNIIILIPKDEKDLETLKEFENKNILDMTDYFHGETKKPPKQQPLNKS